MAKGMHGWSRNEIALLRQLAEEPLPPPEIAARLGRPLDQIERQAAAKDIALHRPPLKKPVRLSDV